MLKFSFRQQVLTGFIVSLLLVFCAFYFSFISINRLLETEKLIDYSDSVIKAANRLQTLLLDSETGQRGFIASGERKFLEPYNKSISLIPSSISRLKAIVANDSSQARNADSLAVFASLKSNELKLIVAIAQSKGFDTARKVLATNPGKYYMDQVRIWNERITEKENRFLAVSKAASASAGTRTVTTILITGLLVVCIVLMLSFYIRKSFENLRRSEENAKIANKELEKVLDENRAKNWLLSGTDLLYEKMQGQQNEKELAEKVLTEICRYTNALTGTFYLYHEATQTLDMYASYAFHDVDAIKRSVKLTEGWIGQVAINKEATLIKGKLNDTLALGSSLVQQNLVECFIVPLFFENALKAVIEVAFDSEPGKNVRDYILEAADDIGIAINTAQARTIMHDLLSQVQQQAEELEAQQEEMRVANEELLSKTELLQDSEEELKAQQEELRLINSELSEKASLLEEKNQAIEEARRAIDLKVKELEATGRYKSEFLANMSHELRTPLNSILVLAQILRENKPVNLTADQIKYAGVIFTAGTDLLNLINDILDLSKMESGKFEIQNETVEIAGILQNMEMLFGEVARSKKIRYTTSINKELPKHIITDKVRVEQIMKNLLSNAFKFTPQNGSIAINIVPGAEEKTISFCIKDSGIGIAHDKQKIIFEAFQQADGSTSRKYGGTGLGLSISRELVKLLGGKISVISEPGQGSEFILTLPFEPDMVVAGAESFTAVENFTPGAGFLKPAIATQRQENKEPLVIIVEDDKNFADILDNYSHDHGYKSIIINEGTNAVEIIKKNQPDAVILDVMLPGKDGWQILKELKQAPETLHIPVHLMSAGEAAPNRVRREGAINFLKKPMDTDTLNKLFGDIMKQGGSKLKQILLIEDNRDQSQALKDLMQNQGIAVDQAFDGESAFRMLDENEYQCIILDLNLPDISGLDFLDKIKENDRLKELPVIVNTAMDLDKNSVKRLMRYANAMVVKTNKSADRLIDEVNLFLNKVKQSADPGKSYQMATDTVITQGKDALKGKKVLIVDDDMRNIFALSSALQNYDMDVIVANDGQEAINKLEETTDIDLVLMDIMMPVMDGYEATRHIRKQNKWAKLPVIALTAKAMMDDREKCIAAGANDYITKPVDIERLVSLMQVWLAV